MKKPIIRWSIAVVVAVLLFLVVPQFFARDLQEESARNLAALWLVAYPVFSVIGGIVAGEAVDKKALRTILLNLREGTTEVMLHPGTSNEILIPSTQWDHDFEGELDAVTDDGILQLVQEQKISVQNFRDL